MIDGASSKINGNILCFFLQTFFTKVYFMYTYKERSDFESLILVISLLFI